MGQKKFTKVLPFRIISIRLAIILFVYLLYKSFFLFWLDFTIFFSRRYVCF